MAINSLILNKHFSGISVQDMKWISEIITSKRYSAEGSEIVSHDVLKWYVL